MNYTEFKKNIIPNSGHCLKCNELYTRLRQHVNFCLSENEFLDFLPSNQLEPLTDILVSEKAKIKCSYCYESFICTNRHRCKVKNGVLSSVFPLSDSLFSPPHNLNKKTHLNNLDLGFTEDGNSINTFEYEVLRYLSDFKDRFSIGYLNINSVYDTFCDVKFILDNKLLDISVISESKLHNVIDDEDFNSIN